MDDILWVGGAGGDDGFDLTKGVFGGRFEAEEGEGDACAVVEVAMGIIAG